MLRAAYDLCSLYLASLSLSLSLSFSHTHIHTNIHARDAVCSFPAGSGMAIGSTTGVLSGRTHAPGGVAARRHACEGDGNMHDHVRMCLVP